MTVIEKKKDPALYELVAFVARGRDSKHFNPAMGNIHAEREEEGQLILVGTDGKRLHMAKVADRFNLALEDGNWEPVITKDQIILKEPETDGVFPNWRRVVPQEVHGKEVIKITDTRMSRKPEVAEKLSRMLWAIFEKAGQIVNIRYLMDLMTGEWNFTSEDYKETSPLVFNRKLPAGEATALIMPIAVG